MMNNFSPNMLKTFDECQMKFFFKYVEKISIPQRAKLFEKGKKVHALANYYLKGSDIQKMERVLTSDEKTTWDSLKSSKYFKLTVINTEYNLSCKIGDYWIGGRLDALMCDEETVTWEKGTEEAKSDESTFGLWPFAFCSENPSPITLHSSLDYYILDYKTGRIPPNPEKDFQTIVYLLAVEKFLKTKKIPCKSLQFIYLGLKDNVEKSILLNEDLKKQYEEKIISLCQKIDLAINSTVFSKSKDSCKCCEYGKFCN